MLCQKCGLQDATVHLESVIFRQKIEEHLCGLCAGARGGGAMAHETRERGFENGMRGLAGEAGDQSMTPRIQSKILQLLRLSKQQGYLTFADIEAALPDSVDSHGEINFVLAALEALEIEMLDVDQATTRQPSKGKSPVAPRSDVDPVADYLKQFSAVRPLTIAQETVLFKRVEKAELSAQEIAFSLPTIGRYFAEVGAKLLVDQESLRRVIDRAKMKSPALYLESLPALLEAVHRHEAHVVKAWDELCAARTAAKRKASVAKLRRRESALRALVPRFCFKLRVYEEYLAQLQPVLREIPELRAKVKSSARPSSKRPVSAQVSAAKSRLAAIGNEQRIAPARLVAAARKITERVMEAHRAKAKLVEAHLPDVILVAKEHVNRGLSFIELIKEGSMGLTEAVESFDHRKGQKFTAFATPWIRQAIARAIARNSAP